MPKRRIRSPSQRTVSPSVTEQLCTVAADVDAVADLGSASLTPAKPPTPTAITITSQVSGRKCLSKTLSYWQRMKIG